MSKSHGEGQGADSVRENHHKTKTHPVVRDRAAWAERWPFALKALWLPLPAGEQADLSREGLGPASGRTTWLGVAPSPGASEHRPQAVRAQPTRRSLCCCPQGPAPSSLRSGTGAPLGQLTVPAAGERPTGDPWGGSRYPLQERDPPSQGQQGEPPGAQELIMPSSPRVELDCGIISGERPALSQRLSCMKASQWHL